MSTYKIVYRSCSQKNGLTAKYLVRNTAIHMKARIACKIPGADKSEDELTDEERTVIERLEHRRWNAYMRSEGYIYSGSPDKASRNDLGKMHHDLVNCAALPDEEKRKDSRVGTK